MFCLRSWLPLLFIPTNASPLFIISFVALTYFLHRPCIYCSALLLILFLSSCNWSDRCFFDFRGDWLSPRFGPGSLAATGSNNNNSSSNSCTGYNNSSAVMGTGDFLHAGIDNNNNDTLTGFILETANTTTKALAGAVFEGMQRRFSNGDNGSGASVRQVCQVQGQCQEGEWAGVGAGWLRSLVGRQEWTLPCIDVKIRL